VGPRGWKRPRAYLRAFFYAIEKNNPMYTLNILPMKIDTKASNVALRLSLSGRLWITHLGRAYHYAMVKFSIQLQLTYGQMVQLTLLVAAIATGTLRFL
jgi:hypothetical protein